MSLSTFRLLRVDDTRRYRTRTYVLVPNATAGQGYNNTNGQVIDFTAATNPRGLARRNPPALPLFSEDDVAIVKEPLGFHCEIKRAAASPTLKNFVLRIFNIATAAELATADYPAAVAGKDIVVEVTTNKTHG